MAVEMSADQFERLIATLRGGGGGGAAGAAGAATVVGLMGPYHLPPSKNRAIIDLLRMEQGSRGFMDFLADVEDQMHLCHSWETLTGEDMKRISLLGGLKDRMRAAT